MAKQLFANNASALLAASIDDNDLTVQVDSGFGALFPSPGAGEYFLVTLVNASGDFEIVKVESRATDLLTIATGGRGQEGTSAQAWVNGNTRVELRVTKGTLDGMLQRSGGTMTGDLDMDNNDIVDARLTGDTVMVAGQLVGTKIRGVEDDGSNEIDVPADGSRATAGGVDILVATDVALIKAAAFAVGQIIMWFGASVSIPAGWKLCNGANGTPDLRDKFIVGAGSAYALSATGGATSGATSSNGAHTHTTDTPAHALDISEMPSHDHTVAGAGATGAGGDLLYGIPNGIPKTTSATGGGAGHTHPASTTGSDGAHTHTANSLPPYYGLFFIMYTG